MQFLILFLISFLFFCKVTFFTMFKDEPTGIWTTKEFILNDGHLQRTAGPPSNYLEWQFLTNEWKRIFRKNSFSSSSILILYLLICFYLNFHFFDPGIQRSKCVLKKCFLSFSYLGIYSTNCHEKVLVKMAGTQLINSHL